MDAQALFGNPGVGFLSMLLIGAIAGWIAEKVTQSDHSIFTNILVLLRHKHSAVAMSRHLSGAAWASREGPDKRDKQSSTHGCD